MNIDDQTNKLIEDYITGQLGQKDAATLEERMKAEPELRAAVAMERSLQSAYKAKAKDDLAERIKTVETNLEKENFYQTANIIPMKKRILSIVSIAASLVILVGAYLLLNQDSTDPATNQGDLFSSYIKKDMNYSNDALVSFGTRGGGGGDEVAAKKANSLKSMFQFLDQGEYLSSRKLALEYLELYPEDQEAQYIMATSHLYEGNYAKAIEWYGKLRQADSRDIRHEAEYYYGLCHVKVENGAAEAKRILQGVAADNTSEWQQTAQHYIGDIE